MLPPVSPVFIQVPAFTGLFVAPKADGIIPVA